MYRIMVVEDSKPIMRNIISQLQLIDNRLQIVETAYNGGDALEKLKNVTIDILFTDIKMPVMDGLSLIQEAKKLYSSLQCVVISGYDDFEYARQAIKLHVNEYILKPVDTEDLKKVINNLTHLIDEQRYTSLEKNLNSLIVGKHLDCSKTTLSYLKSYIMILVRKGFSRKGNDIIDTKIIRDYLYKIDCYNNTWILDTGFPCELAIVFDMDKYQDENLVSKLDELLKLLCINYKQVNILVSNIIRDVYDLSIQYDNLSNILNSLITIGSSNVFYQNLLDKHANLTKPNNEVIYFTKRLSFFIKNRQINAFKTEFQKFINECRNNNYPVAFIRKHLTILIDEINRTFNNSDLNSITEIASKVDELLSECYSYTDIYTNISTYIESLLISTSEAKKNSTNELFESIVLFIQENIYGNITLKDISDKFNISTSYISRLMKLKFSQSPMDYYMKLKMEEAKKLIASNDNILIKDISDSLGFSDQHYFSKVFKTYVGISPTEFKIKK